MSKHEAHLLGEDLKYPVYYSDIPKSERATILRKLSSGELKLVVATSSLGVGIDILSLCILLTPGMPMRGTELSGLNAVNAGNTMRNVFIHV
ncbi:hypothetical protein FQN49_001817 [Arthroderma sp. PD_2]|nr:hypothetical protein FQN49_001817 [Arthroderma sp. PD_2]